MGTDINYIKLKVNLIILPLRPSVLTEIVLFTKWSLQKPELVRHYISTYKSFLLKTVTQTCEKSTGIC
jgi:hypothetical protein